MIENPINAWFGICSVIVAGSLFAASLFLWLHERNIRFLRPLAGFVRRPWFEVAVLLLFVGGMVQYGSTKGFLGAPSMAMLSPMAAVQLPTVANDSDEATEAIFPAFTNAVTNVCFTGIKPASTSVYLRAHWPPNLYPAPTGIEIYAAPQPLTNARVGVGAATVDTRDNSAIVEIPYPLLPDGWATSMFFMFGLNIDSDGDGLSDAFERIVAKTNPSLADTDGDGMPDGWEYSKGLDPNSGVGADGADGDADGDGLANIQEYDIGTNPLASDSDGDGISDHDELGSARQLADFVWYDTAGGADILANESDMSIDDRVWTTNLAYAVTLGGKVYDRISVDSNALVYLIPSNSVEVTRSRYSCARLPADVLAGTNIAIAVNWRDMRVNRNNGSEIRVCGVSSNETTVVEFTNLEHQSNASSKMTAQVVVGGTNGTILVNYLSVAPNLCGDNASIGLMNSTVHDFADTNKYYALQWSYYTAGSITSQVSIAYHVGTGSNPAATDSDGDGLSDRVEVFTLQTDPCAADTDRDGLDDNYEVANQINPLSHDTDGDGMPDGWEVQYGLNPRVDDAFGDLDEDGLPNICEYSLNTKVGASDSDNDGLLDGREAAWIDTRATIPWFDTSGGTVLLSAGNVDRMLCPIALPTAVALCGETVTHALVDVNGIVRFGRPATTGGVDSVDGIGDLGYNRNFQTVVIAPFSADLRTRSSLQSKITVRNLTYAGTRYAVFNFARIGTSSSDSNEVSFQVSVPLNCESNVVYVRYGDVINTGTHYVSIGAQGTWNWPRLKYWYGQSPNVTNGLSMAYHLGCGSNPLSRDSDDDGLDDYRECELGTNPHHGDSDDDGLDDEWEASYGLNPLSEEGSDGPEGDPDGDGLSNAREYDYRTNPISPYTDDDLIPDGVEVGYVTTNTTLPWLVFDSYEDITSLISTNNRRCVSCATPSALRIQGETVTNLTISANGVVFLNHAGYANQGNSTSSSRFSSAVDANALVLAPYLQYAYIRSDIAGRQTSIRYGTATHDGNGYLLIEYLNSYYNTSTRPTNSISFQLAVPTNFPEKAYARYKDVLGTYMTGGRASVGMQSFDGKWMHSWCYQEDNRVMENLALEFVFGTNSDPCSKDSDNDGLDDDEELQRGTNLGDNDTDADGLLDGWEVSYGLNPLSSSGDDGPDGDFDGDGLDNRLELACATAPNDVDTDGDGLNDLIEAGGFLRTNPLPWFDMSSATDLTSAFNGGDEGLVNIQHSGLTAIRNVAVSNIVLDVNGILYLRRTGNTSGVYSSGYGYSMAGYTRDNQSVSIAPFWTDFDLTATNEPSSKISTKVVVSGGLSYRVIEYANMWTRRYSNDPWLRISFQVSIPHGDTDRVYIRYADGSGPPVDGRYASIGFQGWNGHNRRSFCYYEEGKLSSGTGLTFVIGTGSNPNVKDSDNDGLSDSEEISISTNPLQPDSDGDGLSDGWESRYASDGFDPTEANTNDPVAMTGPNDDLDGDGLSNREECDWNTNPNALDSDGDGVDDGDEIGQFSDPDDETDDGRPACRVPVIFTFGDHSGSHSEKYRLELTPVAPRDRTVSDGEMPKSVSWVNAEYGECETKTAMLARGFDYELRMYHAGTNEEDSPDYDYRLTISYPPTVGIVTNDPSGLIKASDMTSDYFSGAGKVATIRVLDAAIYGDYDRNGKIDENDRVALYKNRFLRHWVNDDEDDGDVNEGGGDIPGACEGWLEWDGRDPNWQDFHVNGRCDLLDFAPVRLDIKGMLSQLDGLTSDYAFRLSHADGAVKVVWTSENADNANSFLKADMSNCGVSLSQASRSATTVLVDSEGVSIPPSFINGIRSDSKKGIFMIEGCEETTSPLVFECRRSSDDELVFKVSMPLSVSSVEKMYRWIGLRHILGESDVSGLNTNEPSNLPDAEMKDSRHFIFVHGYNVNEESARGWAAEMFKRLWQSGSQARFTAVDWYGNESQIWEGVPVLGGESLDYYVNVRHALDTASGLARAVNALSGDKIMLAHSLGNMLVSAAAKDHQMAYSKYYMLNAAVPVEAYDATASNAEMREHGWSDVPLGKWAANWHTHIPYENDPRRTLKWTGRFAGIHDVINCYSSTEDVLTNPTANGWGGAWGAQELFKGTSTLHVIPSNCEGGWGYNDEHTDLLGQLTDSAKTNSFTDAELMASPIFRKFDNALLHQTNSISIAQTELNKVMGDGIPAKSFAAGANQISVGQISNYDYQGQTFANGWPRSNSTWRHSDIKNVAYFYVFNFFNYLMGDSL